MGNCLKTQLKSSVNNDNLDYLGMSKVHYSAASVDSGYLQCAYRGIALGAKVLNGDTFYDGSTEITSINTPIRVAAGDNIDVLFPKYTGIPEPTGVSRWNDTYAKSACNIDDFNYYIDTHPTPSGSTAVNFYPTADGYKSSGHIDNLLTYIFPSVVNILLSDSNITLDLNDTILSDRIWSFIYAINCPNVTGVLEDFLETWMEKNKTALMSENANMSIRVGNSGVTCNILPKAAMLSLYFTANSNIVSVRSSGTEIYTYNMDTKDWTSV